MLTKRIIPCLDVQNGRVVKCVKFQNARDAGDPVEAAAFYDKAGADELTFLDITASHERRKTVIEIATTMHWLPKNLAPSSIRLGFSIADEFIEILSAPFFKISLMSSVLFMPPPIVYGINTFSAALLAISITVFLLS